MRACVRACVRVSARAYNNTAYSKQKMAWSAAFVPEDIAAGAVMLCMSAAVGAYLKYRKIITR